MNATAADIIVSIAPGAGALPQTDDDLADVLFEQLGYLIEFSDQERYRFERVKAILLEGFQ